MFMPHMPLPQKFVPHMPFPHSSLDCVRDFPDCAAKVEYWVVRWDSPQDGQRTAPASALRRTSFSNLLPQSSQEYSKIGIPSRYQCSASDFDAVP
jgi:hypothetical protein